jgi:hypothetical protein
MVVYVIGRFNEFGGSNELVSSDYLKIEEKLEKLKYDKDDFVEKRGNVTLYSSNEYFESGVFVEKWDI